MMTNEKVLILGIDGMDPRFTKKLVSDGKLPNIKKYLDRGAAREDLAMLGGTPTITPPMWTTMSTGATPATHGITCFWNQDHDHLDTLTYNLISTNCKAEQLWNVTAEAGLKTLVFHWPGSSWPPTSPSPNLHVVDGTSPGTINSAAAGVDGSYIVYAGEEVKELIYVPFVANDCGAGCVIHDLPEIKPEIDYAHKLANIVGANKNVVNIMLSHEDGEMATERVPNTAINSPLTAASGWHNAPKDAKQFYIYVANGTERRPCLLLKGAQDNYDTVAVYHNKKDDDPLFTLSLAEGDKNIIDTIRIGEQTFEGYRTYHLTNIAPDGSNVTLAYTSALDIHNDSMWWPKSLYHDVIAHSGYVPTPGMTSGMNVESIKRLTLSGWRRYDDWQADAMKYLIESQDYKVVFSHLHNLDTFGHGFFHYAVSRKNDPDIDIAGIQECMEQAYRDTDDYLGQFMYLLDEGWTIIILSDHGLLCSYEEMPPLLGDPFGVNIRVMQQIGFTALKTDDNGNELREIDWSKTKAIASRGNYIWLNLIGRDEHGIVKPEDKYDVERELIDALYNYRDPQTGKRVVSIAMRNKEAAILGMNGPETGDIIYMLEEGFNRVHGDSLPTFHGFLNTSVSPIFIAAGQGVQQGITTDRVIRQIDVAPTVAAILGVKMPAQCEGAPVYQILKD